MLIEGEEEAASASLVPFLEANHEELRADVCVVSDTGMIDVDRPAITYMLRGIAYSRSDHGPTATCIPACTAAPSRTRSTC